MKQPIIEKTIEHLKGQSLLYNLAILYLMIVNLRNKIGAFEYYISLPADGLLHC